ncbi:MAG: hypothetical protein L0228_14835 [Planctomycetes bacterium]|nr:hypothetical protein [Planctomycetota bacterium]
MLRNRLKASLAGCVFCGCAFAGGLLANGVAADKAVVSGVLVTVAASAFAALLYFARKSAERA